MKVLTFISLFWGKNWVSATHHTYAKGDGPGDEDDDADDVSSTRYWLFCACSVPIATQRALQTRVPLSLHVGPLTSPHFADKETEDDVVFAGLFAGRCPKAAFSPFKASVGERPPQCSPPCWGAP